MLPAFLVLSTSRQSISNDNALRRQSTNIFPRRSSTCTVCDLAQPSPAPAVSNLECSVESDLCGCVVRPSPPPCGPSWCGSKSKIFVKQSSGLWEATVQKQALRSAVRTNINLSVGKLQYHVSSTTSLSPAQPKLYPVFQCSVRLGLCVRRTLLARGLRFTLVWNQERKSCERVQQRVKCTCWRCGTAS